MAKFSLIPCLRASSCVTAGPRQRTRDPVNFLILSMHFEILMINIRKQIVAYDSHLSKITCGLHLGHPGSSIQADDGTVEHLILDTLSRQLGKLIRPARTLRVNKGALQVLPGLLGHGARHASFEQARGNSDSADTEAT